MIYCVEDDSSIRDLMIYALQTAGFEAEGFAESTAFWRAMEQELPQLILLDIMLPKEDGITILKKLRAHHVYGNVPVIMATARGSEYDRVIGLDSGADDYLSKPFGMMEMISRIKAVLRRSTVINEQSVISRGPITLDRKRHEVFVDKREVRLTLKEYDLLLLFMENPGRVFTREMLLESVWNEDFLGETRTVDVHIGTLRTKLGDASDEIQTIRGVGYRMG